MNEHCIEANKLAIIVNADDFGKNQDVNKAVLQCFQNRWISSASLMANAPGFDEARQIIGDYDLSQKIGVHMTLTEGMSLSENIRSCPRLCNSNGFFVLDREKRILYLSHTEKEAISLEAGAQIKKCQDSGLSLTHLDSHHNIHEEFPILQIIVPMLRQYGIPRIRILNNLCRETMPHKAAYRRMINWYLRLLKVPRSELFGTAEQLHKVRNRYYGTVNKCVVEVMVHPILDCAGNVVDALNDKPMKEIASDLHIERCC
jgi:predicted glycoside hydrolase/deacetylase ChbG (UPF0249 family)